MYKTLLYSLLIFSLLWSCQNEMPIEEKDPNSSHIKYFGFTLVDTYWDDPTDTEVKTNYATEVSAFSNIADILVVNPTDDLIERIDNMHSLDMQAVLHLNSLLFEIVGTDSPSGTDYQLRADFKERWDEFTVTNDLNANKEKIKVFYIGEEPTWNGITFEEMDRACSYIKNQFLDIPIMLIEAHPILDNLTIPESVDWYGFDRYFIQDPNTDTNFQNELNIIKSKQSRSDQKLVVVMDTHFIQSLHGDFGNISINDMDNVANRYYDLAKSDSSCIAILGYFWPNGFDLPESIGARGMPQNVKDEYIRIGKEITGKP